MCISGQSFFQSKRRSTFEVSVLVMKGCRLRILRLNKLSNDIKKLGTFDMVNFIEDYGKQM